MLPVFPAKILISAHFLHFIFGKNLLFGFLPVFHFYLIFNKIAFP